jgi:probable F420-dependent oxidoreductase
VRFGITLPQFGPVVAPGLIADFARGAEELGYQSLWVGDRVLAPLKPSQPYPGYTAEKPLPDAFGTFLDPLAVLVMAASATSTARLGSSTLNATWYHPLVLGRTLTTLDQLSAGRLDAGFGLGWMQTEYDALGIPWSGRGARLEETLDVLQVMWAGSAEPVQHHGKLWDIPPSTLDLRPVQPGGPPVLLGGYGPRALDRVGRRASGWLPSIAPGRGLTVAMLDKPWQTIIQAAEAAGRDPATLRRELRVNLAAGPDMVGTAIGFVHEARELGYDGAFADPQFAVGSPAEMTDCAGELMAAYRAG